MKISKSELLALPPYEDSLERFICQTKGTDEPVEIASLVGGENTMLDLMWLAGEILHKKKLIKFACKCALINIELIKPYTDGYDLIVGFLENPTDTKAEAAAKTAAEAAAKAYKAFVYAEDADNVAEADTADAAAKAAACVYKAIKADKGAYTAGYVYAAAEYAVEVASSDLLVNEYLRELFEE